MLDPEKTKHEYDSIAAVYNNHYGPSPTASLEHELIGIALGDLTGRTVLDLGGGSGLHARHAVELGAVAVDIIDVSPGMLKVAADIEKAAGRGGVMRFFAADAAKPLSHLPLREGGYDVVMANWVFDFAETVEVLEAMFRNAVRYLKTGGLFVGVRIANPYSTVLKTGQHGLTFTSMQPIPGGVKYREVILSDPPIESDAASLEVLYSGSPAVYEEAGLTGVEIIPYTAGSVVDNDPWYWADFLKDPFFAVVKALKK
jgi:ubiquinone/menaquinone biosynthesis C-methylase UbiE